MPFLSFPPDPFTGICPNTYQGVFVSAAPKAGCVGKRPGLEKGRLRPGVVTRTGCEVRSRCPWASVFPAHGNTVASALLDARATLTSTSRPTNLMSGSSEPSVASPPWADGVPTIARLRITISHRTRLRLSRNLSQHAISCWEFGNP